MMEYLLKSMLCLVLLLLFHKLFLQQEVLHRFNRFYLLGAVVFSFLIPLYVVEIESEELIVISEPTAFEPQVFQSEYEFPAQTVESQTVEVQASKAFPWSEVLFGAYTLVSLIFLIRFFRNIRILFNQIHRNVTVTFKGYPVVLLEENTLPYSFLKYMFVSKNAYESGEFSEEVFQHELAHVKEGHSWDVLFIELLLIPFWFHPGLYFAKQSIRLNHEFIADQVALKSTSIQAYQHLLLSMTLTNPHNSLVSSLNFSLTKKRLEMMKKKSNPIFKWVKLFVLIPVLGVMVYVFSEKVTAHQEADKVEQYELLSSTEIEKDFTINSDGTFFYQGKNYLRSQLPSIIENFNGENTIVNIFASSNVKMGDIQDFQQSLRESGVNKVKYQSSTGEIQLAATKTVNLGPIVNNVERDRYYKNATFFVENKSGDLEEKSFDMLSDGEKKMLSFFPTAPKASSPTLEEFESWKDPKNFALWLNGAVISNDDLNQMTSDDIVFYNDSFVHTNARSERFPQEHQVHMYNQEGFEKNYGPESGFVDPLTKEDKLYLYPSENRVNRGNPWVKDAKSLVTVYLEMNEKYEKLRKAEPHFVHRSEEEQRDLEALFSELGSLYIKIPLELKGTIFYPTYPFVPYVKLKSEEGVYYKMVEDMTEEEKQKFPPPPPPASKDKVEAYHQLYLKYEWLRMEGRKYSNKSQEDRAYMYELYNAMQSQFMAMNPIQRRQVKRVNFPFVPLNENGQLTFKVIDEMTPEQRALAGC